MRKILAILILTTSAYSLEANSIVWHKGSVVLTNKEVVTGEIARQSSDLLLLRNSKGVCVYPAHKVSSFRFHDDKENINRIFIVIDNRYFERVVNGRISVFRIQKVFDQAINENDPDLYDYYIESERRVCSLKQFRSRYFEIVKQELDLIPVPYKHLDPNTAFGAVSLIVLYNKSAPATISSTI